MKGKSKIFNKIFALIFMILIFAFGNIGVEAANIKNGQTVDKDKTWIIHFNKEIELDQAIEKEIKVLDLEGKEINPIVELGEDKRSIKVKAPINGYKLNGRYTLVIGGNISSRQNEYLNKEVMMNFNIKSYDKETIMDKLVVLPNKAYNKEEAEEMINRLSNIPYPILEELLKYDIKIILSNANITEVREYAYLKGVTPRGWEGTGRTWDDVPGAGGKPVVARIGYSNPGEAHGSINLELHETAHAIDAYVFNNVSASEGYKAMWNKEVKRVFGNDPYFVNYPEEYFAETFAMYYLSAEQNKILEEKAPLTYKFIKNLESEIEGVVSYNANYSLFLLLINRNILWRNFLVFRN